MAWGRDSFAEVTGDPHRLRVSSGDPGLRLSITGLPSLFEMKQTRTATCSGTQPAIELDFGLPPLPKKAWRARAFLPGLASHKRRRSVQKKKKKKLLIYGDGETLHLQKAPHIWRWGHFALPKSSSYTDPLHWQKAPHIWRWGHFALAESPSYTAMGTLCTAKRPLIYGDGDTLNWRKARHIWRWGHFALPKSPS